MTTLGSGEPRVDDGCVYVVEDDAGMRQTIIDILALAGITADGFESGSSALGAAHGPGRPALVVLDHRLPDTTGIELAANLKSRDADLAIVLLTGYASAESAIAAVGLVDDYLIKPIPPEALVRRVVAGLERNQLRRENRALVGRLQEMNSSLEDTVAQRTKELTKAHDQALTDQALHERLQSQAQKEQLENRLHEVRRIEMAAHAEELQRSNAELEQFAYVASHDLSEPLRTVAGYVGLIARRYRGQIDDDVDRFITHTEEGCARMRDLIDDLLLYSQAGRSPDLTNLVDSTQVVGNVLTGLGARVSEVGATIEVGDLPMVRVDPGQLAQLFQNLITNGLKFTNQGVAPCIHITAEDQGDKWVFAVADNGIGIEPEYRDRIFRMFQRLHARDAYSGTGIGLAICLRIIDAHGGRIWVEDRPGGGTRFCFSVPGQTERLATVGDDPTERFR